MRSLALVAASLSLSLVVQLLRVDSVFACMCIRTPLSERLEEVEAVFYGRAVEVTGPNWVQTGNIIALQQPYVSVARFSVERTWKGLPASERLVTTGESDCGQHFKQGESYLVWAYPTPDEPEYRVEGALAADFGACGASRPGPVGDQDEDIRVLNYETSVAPLLRKASVPVTAGLVALAGGLWMLRRSRRSAQANDCAPWRPPL